MNGEGERLTADDVEWLRDLKMPDEGSWSLGVVDEKTAPAHNARIDRILSALQPQPKPEGVREAVALTADEIARAVCAERCGAYGEPACYTLYGVDWDGGKCDNLHDCDCASIASAVLALHPSEPHKDNTPTPGERS